MHKETDMKKKINRGPFLLPLKPKNKKKSKQLCDAVSCSWVKYEDYWEDFHAK